MDKILDYSEKQEEIEMGSDRQPALTGAASAGEIVEQ